MAERDDNESERFQEKPRRPAPREENIQPSKPGPAKAPADDWDEEPQRPRRRPGPPERRRRDDDGVATIIPYRNGLALAGYYVGVFSLIPVVGLILGPLGIIFGIVGLRRVNRNPDIKGTGHAVTAIVLGGIATLVNWGFVILMLVGYLLSRR
jgi:hypothetical protein